MTRIFSMWLVLLVVALPMASMAQSVPQSRDELTYSYAPLVKRAAPAVVNIYARKFVRQRALNPLMADPFFREFFGDALPPGLSRERVQNALGSGVIVRADGLIVTNNHVIRDADEIRVVLNDRREFAAEIATSDSKTDLAVLRITNLNGERLPFLELRDSDTVEVGDLVLAIGNPFGIGQTVTSGVISAIARTDIGNNDLNYYLQTDAAINPGNSGGALVTMDGRLVGINTAIFTQSGGSIGIGFAVPANMVRVVVNAVETGQKRVVRPWLGIDGQDVTPELAASLGLSRPKGVLVTRVREGSPAASAGLRVGEVIISLDGRELADLEELRFRVATLAIGTVVRLGVQARDGTQRALSLQLIAPPENVPRQETTLRGNHPLGGLIVANLSPALADELQMPDDSNGVVVLGAGERSVARQLGLRRGDILVALNNQPVTNVAELQVALKRPSDVWQLNVLRGTQQLNLLVR